MAAMAMMQAGALCATAALVLAAGCASPPEPAPPLPAPTLPSPPTPSRAAPRAAAESPLADFTRDQREAARLAVRQGRWADALWAWEVVLALEPQDAEALAQRAAAQAAAAAAVADRLPRAQMAQQRGQWETAARLYLEVLAIDPSQSPAADALREIERSRMRRLAMAGLRDGQATPAAATAGRAHRAAATPAPPAVAPASHNNDAEHASMLASQGDIDAAIALLRPQASAPGAAPQTRRLLASFYFRQASRLELNDRAAAVHALVQGLVLDPGHRVAAARLRLLRPAPAGSLPAPAALQPLPSRPSQR